MASGGGSSSEPGPSVPIVKSSGSLEHNSGVPAHGNDGLRQEFEDKKYDAFQAFNVLQEVKDHALAIDAHKLPIDELIRTITARRARLVQQESAATALAEDVRQLGRKLRVMDPESDAKAARLFNLVEEAKIYLDALKDWAAAEQAAPSRSRSVSNGSCVQDIDNTNWQSSPLNPPRVSRPEESIVFRYDFMAVSSLAGPTGDFIQGPIRPLAPIPDRRLSPQITGDQQQQTQAAQAIVLPPQAQLDRRLPPQAVGDRELRAQDYWLPHSIIGPPSPVQEFRHIASPGEGQPSHVSLPHQQSNGNLLSFGNPPAATGVLANPAPLGANPSGQQWQQTAFPGNRSSLDHYSLGRKARQVPKFSGDTKKFREWEQLFKVFVDDTPAPTIEKFNLLRTSLMGRAKDAIAHLQWEESHYSIAKSILRERFGDYKLAQRSHIQEIDNLVDRGGVSNARLEAFTDSLCLHVRALIALGVTFTELSTTTTQRVLRCLPMELREKFIVKLAEARLVDPLITDLDFMLKFLETTVKVRREAEWGASGFSQRPHRRQFQPNVQEHRFRSNAPGSSFPRDNHSLFAANQQRQPSARQQNGGTDRGRINAQATDRRTDTRRTTASSTRAIPSTNRPAPPALLPPTVRTLGMSTLAAAQPSTSGNNQQEANRSCIFCEGSHESYRCRLVLSHAERIERIENQNGCVTCLKRNHNSRNCRDGPRTNCPKCNARHYLIMCPRSRADDSSYHISSSASAESEAEILLQTAVVWVESGSSRKLARILLDTGAHRSYVDARTAQDIDSIPAATIQTSVKTLGNIVSVLDTCVHRITLRSRHNPSQTVTIDCIETPEITDSILPEVSDNLGLQPVADAVREDGLPRTLSIIVGAVDLAPIHTGIEKIAGRMMATSSIFGWLFSGTFSTSPAASNTPSLLCQIHPTLPITVDPDVECGLTPPSLIHRDVCRSNAKRDASLDSDLRFLWEGEFMGFEAPTGVEEKDDLSQELSHFFERTTLRHPEGFYELCLPFKDNLSNLADNEGLAKSRLFSLIRKLRKKEGHLAAVDDEIRKSLEQGFAEEASSRQDNQLIHFLPLQAVFKYGPDGVSILKTRVVKDASARTSNRASLNDCLYPGDNLLPLIPKVLCAFRECLYPITADIQNAFLQFRLNPSNRPLLRFLWPLGVSRDASAPIKEFWSTRLEFGLTCSPWCHIKGVQHHLQRSASELPARAAFIEEISHNLYMDDVVFRTNSVEEAEEKIAVLFDVFQSAHWPLKKWGTTNARIAENIKHTSPVPETEVTFDKPDAKFLGVKWMQPSDRIGVFTEEALAQLRVEKPSKRALLKGLARIYDPLGLLSPVTIRAKTLFQALWKEGVNWDDDLSEEIQIRYRSFVELLSSCSNFSVDRSLAPRYTNASFEIHTFCDASLDAYGCAVYLRTIFENQAAVQLIVSKARVAPLKNKGSIARYELMGGLLAAKIATQTREFLKIKVSKLRFWIDNMACVCWIKSNPDRWQPFVANRVRLIQKLTSSEDWSYVRTDENPSDIVSRGTDISSAEHRSRWLHGPEWLRDPNWSPPTSLPAIETTDEEKRQTPKLVFHVIRYNDSNVVDDYLSPQRHSSWYKLLRAQAWCNRLRRFAEAVRQKQPNPIIRGRRATLRSAALKLRLRLDTNETSQAELDLIRRMQQRHFASEIAHGCRNIAASSPLYQYSPFLDSNGVVRCRSRLERTKELPYVTKYPIIIPSEGGWAKLIILNVHSKECWHWGGVANTLQALRRRFFILKARRIATSTLKKCIGCRHILAKAAEQESPPLPPFRIEESPPFLNAGVDFFGPLYFKTEENRRARGYVLIFACCVTRAIHRELTVDMSTFEVLRSLQKFLHRYPSAKNFLSDNGAAFHRAEVELKLIYQHIAGGYIDEWLSENHITWSFITPAAPWTGSFYERQIGSVKRCLRKVLGRSTPNFRDLEVILSGAQAVINRRPITTVTTDPNELTALTPANLVTGYGGENLIPQSVPNPQHRADISAVAFSRRWISQQNTLAAFWERYKNEYLVYLRTANQRKPVHQRPLKVGDVCMLKTDEKSRAYWPLVRVTELHPSGDGLARSCSIRTTNGKTLMRPIKLLYKLESSGLDSE